MLVNEIKVAMYPKLALLVCTYKKATYIMNELKVAVVKTNKPNSPVKAACSPLKVLKVSLQSAPLDNVRNKNSLLCMCVRCHTLN